MHSDLVLSGDISQEMDLPAEQAIGQHIATPRQNRYSRWNTAWRNLSFCWKDPDAAENIATAYRIRQIQALLQQIPLSAFNCTIFAALIAYLFWADADHTLLASWCLAIWGNAAAMLFIWQRYRSTDEIRRCEKLARLLTVNSIILGLFYSVVPAYLFGNTDLNGKIFLIAIATGFVSHGALQNSRWPVAGIFWGIGMCVGGAAAILYFYGSTYRILASVTLLYFFIVVISILLSSRLFVKSLMAETKIDQQKQLISLLLHDFEDDASDWLWETDATGHLRHVSSRLADTLGLSPSRLQGQLIINILLGHENAFENVPSDDMQKLAACFNQAGPFRNIELPVMLAGEKRCWSLSGKPLFDNQEKIIGWRGVGSDITAQRELQASREAAARVAGELDAARRIQMGLLPDLAAITNKEHRFSVAATLEPALEVGGDYYDCFALDEKRICFAVADVSGKGVPASLFMAMTKTLAANLARQKADLGEALSELSCELDRNNPEMLFVTTFIAVLDLESGELSCASAGHDLPLLLRAGQVSRLDIEEASGPPMCAVPGYRFQSAKQHLQPGDTLCLFTDGVTEACNGADFYGARRLTHLFASLEDNAPVSSYTDALRRDIREFEIGTAPSDDLTIMVLRWNGMNA